MADRQADHLIRLVDDLLEVARITSGKIELKKQHVDLRDAMRQAIEISQPAINAGRHMMTISLADQPLTVDADAVRLTQVFANLLNNSAKYTPPGGRIASRRSGTATKPSSAYATMGLALGPKCCLAYSTSFIKQAGPKPVSRAGWALV